ncbi:hypothetical protein J2W55_002868 [Mucilaginibacter pocheonensis]|uniref:Uncharacterized protein n=1 Tax=Mucilaginibacter pocheonensis TaxID=398050 RepID=A0ABU1TC89_9SPHI|nr:hypothetical protein [Mucilaginibacter pocheonensis]
MKTLDELNFLKVAVNYKRQKNKFINPSVQYGSPFV